MFSWPSHQHFEITQLGFQHKRTRRQFWSKTLRFEAGNLNEENKWGLVFILTCWVSAPGQEVSWSYLWPHPWHLGWHSDPPQHWVDHWWRQDYRGGHTTTVWTTAYLQYSQHTGLLELLVLAWNIIQPYQQIFQLEKKSCKIKLWLNVIVHVNMVTLSSMITTLFTMSDY